METMETIIISTPEHIAQALLEVGLSPSPEPEGAFWTVTTREGTVRFVVLDRLVQRVVDMFGRANPDRCNDIVEALIRFVEEEEEEAEEAE